MNDLLDLFKMPASKRLTWTEVSYWLGVSKKTVDRLVIDPTQSFPQPDYLRGRKSLSAGALQKWVRAMPQRKAANRRKHGFSKPAA
jgi:predicted DNA-binding transcriptional regulator AlpA